MNKELKIFNNSAIVIDENNKEKKLILTNNLEAILITENNIEYIEKELEKVDFEFKNVTTNNKIIKIINAVGIIGITAICLILGTNNIISLWAMPFLLAVTTGVSVFTFNSNIKYQDTLKLRESILNDSLIEETKKLNELEKAKKIITIQEQKNKKINTSNYLMNLKRKLELIEDYQFMKKELIDYSKDHFISPRLFKYGYSEEDANFICQLVQNDKKQENENDTHKTLIKK